MKMRVKAIWTVGYDGKRYSNNDEFLCDKKWGEKKVKQGKVERVERNLEELDVDRLYEITQEMDIYGRSAAKGKKDKLIKMIKEEM